MLLQSHAGFMHLLPALPTAWADGEVKGLRSRGGFEVTEMQWKGGKVVRLKVKFTIGGNLRLRSNTPLQMADGTGIAIAEGRNSNALMQPYNMPEPIVVNEAKIPQTNLPETWLYDIPTTVGQEIELIPAGSTAIGGITAGISGTDSSAAFSTDGRRVTNSYKGIVIRKGQKRSCKNPL